jgi:preprotein translocase subunit YajC
MFLLQEAPAGGGNFTMLIMMAAVFGIMYFFMIRPQRKREKELQNLREALKKGDEVVTSSGIHGQVAEVKDAFVIISVESAAKIKFDKSAIAMVNGKGATVPGKK